jgi:hypothetical protein
LPFLTDHHVTKRAIPKSSWKKLFNRFKQLGEEFATSGNFSAAIKEALGKPFVLPPVRLFLIKIISKTKLANMYWDNNLKKNNAYIKRFDKPFTNNLYII